MIGADSRCTRRNPVRYVWLGGNGIPSEVEGSDLARAIADRFAVVFANEELRRGLLPSRHFDKYEKRTSAFIEQKINRMLIGRLKPGTEVVPVAKAYGSGIRMFEFRWTRDTRLLRGNESEQIRHYDSEPQEHEGCVFGLHMAVKDLRRGDDDIISKEPNQDIDHALDAGLAYLSPRWPIA